ncbi:hypothetical protein DdX_05455 [Ditylenchus destructor]|uniref:Uncharacterized protein n=1 Tax=Ditylenchus destructor TaxID=166010 RepID=A0AAD4R6N1_9BILA|nr:hypothetical protein DdX_05455 [Ditylenchus destructor]
MSSQRVICVNEVGFVPFEQGWARERKRTVREKRSGFQCLWGRNGKSSGNYGSTLPTQISNSLQIAFDPFLSLLDSSDLFKSARLGSGQKR